MAQASALFSAGVATAGVGSPMADGLTAAGQRIGLRKAAAEALAAGVESGVGEAVTKQLPDALSGKKEFSLLDIGKSFVGGVAKKLGFGNLGLSDVAEDVVGVAYEAKSAVQEGHQLEEEH